MNVRPDQISTLLNESLASAYLVAGDEPLQVMEASDAIRKACRDAGYEDREVFDIDKSFDWQHLIDSAASMSLFATRRIIECRIPDGKPGRQGSDVIKQYLQRPAEDTVLLITAGKVDRKSAWYKSVDKAGVVVDCWPIRHTELPRWLNARFQLSDMRPTPEVIEFMSQHIEGNLLAAAQEIDKLALLLGPGEITLENVQAVLSDSSRYTSFEFADCGLQGDTARLMKITDTLRAEGEPPVLIVWAVSRAVRILIQASMSGSSPDYAFKRLGVWGNQIAWYRATLARHTEASLHDLLQRCARCDGISKGFEAGNIWDELRILGYRLAHGVRRSA